LTPSFSGRTLAAMSTGGNEAEWLTRKKRIDTRLRSINPQWLVIKDDSLEDSDELPEPQDLASEAITELESVVDDLREIITLLEKEEGVEK